MNVSFSVAMMLQAVNNMSPGIQSAIREIEKVGQTAKRVANSTRNMKPFDTWDQGLKKTLQTLDKLDKKATELQKKGSEMQRNGFENLLEGEAISLPIIDMVKKAGDRQAAQMVLMDSGMNRDQVAAITEQSKNLSKDLMFSTNELLAIPLAMNRAGMDAEKIQNSFQQISYEAELEHIRTGRSSYDIAKDLSSMAELAKVTQDETQLKGFMDTVNRIATITTANTGVLAESMKYFGPLAGVYGVTPQDTMMAQGIAARFGIEGSMAGTHLKDFLDRLNPNGRSPKQLAAMYEMGFLQDATVQHTKSGKMKVSGGESVFFQDGKAKNMLDIFGIFADKYKQMTMADPQNGSLKFAGYMKDMLGEQGKDIGMIVAQNVDNIQKMQADYNRVLTIDEGVKNFQTTFKQSFGAFMSNIENLGVDAVTQLMHDLTDGLKVIGPYVDGVSLWVNSHKDLVTWILKTALAISALLLVLGTFRIIGGTALKLMAGGFKFLINPAMAFLFVLRLISGGFGNLKAGFDLVRATGVGFWSSLWQGAKLAWPWLGKISSWTSRFVIQWLFAAGRIAAGWLIAMGPVGWIIAGVTAIIAVAIWAWNTNFMGFRDSCIAAWNLIRDWATRTWNSICQTVSHAIDLVCGWIDKAKEALGLSGKVGGYNGAGIKLKETSFVNGSGSGTNNNVSNNFTFNVPTSKDAGDAAGGLADKYSPSNPDYNPSFGF